MSEGRILSPRYGRLLDDFEVGAEYHHPWELTLDDGLCALFAASFPDATPLFASRTYAAALGLRDRPVHPTLLLNLALSFSVHDVSEQAIAHLATIEVSFPHAAFRGDTVSAVSRVLDKRPAQNGERGVVHVATRLRTSDGEVVCSFERKALVPMGRLTGPHGPRALQPWLVADERQPDDTRLPRPILRWLESSHPQRLHVGFGGYFEDFQQGDVILHDGGKTVGDSEHMQLAQLLRNTHPLHVDAEYARPGIAGERVVYGGLVLAWASALASRDTAGNALWVLGLDRGAHPAAVVAGDTLHAASKVLSVEDRGAHAGLLTTRLVATKNVRPQMLLAAGVDRDLFAEELDKPEAERCEAKVFEITRTLLLRKRPAAGS